MKLTTSVLVATLFVLLGSTFAFAASTADTSVTVLSAALVTLLVKTVFPVISAIVAGFAVVVLRKLSSKFHLGNQEALDTLLTTLANSGVALAEEKALSAVKHSGLKMSKDGKLDIAVAHILNAVPAISRDTAESYATAAVAKLPGVGASDSKVIK